MSVETFKLVNHIKRECKRIVTNYSYRECNNADIRKKVEIRLTEMLGKLLSAGHIATYYVNCGDHNNGFDFHTLASGRLRAMVQFTLDNGGPDIQLDLDAKGLDVTVQTRVDGKITSRLSSSVSEKIAAGTGLSAIDKNGGAKCGEMTILVAGGGKGKSKIDRFDEAMNGIEKEF